MTMSAHRQNGSSGADDNSFEMLELSLEKLLTLYLVSQSCR